MPSSRRVSARSFFAFSALLLFGCKLLLQGLELALEVLDLALCGLCAHICGMVVVLDLCELLDLGLECLVLLLGVAELPLQVLGLDLGSMRGLPLGGQLVGHVAVGVVCHCQLVLGRDTRLLGLVGTRLGLVHTVLQVRNTPLQRLALVLRQLQLPPRILSIRMRSLLLLPSRLELS